MFRTFQVKVANDGTAEVDVGPDITNVEWDVYQISVQTSIFNQACVCEIRHNGYFLCVSPQGSMDSATGPPDIVVRAGDSLSANWYRATPGDLATVGIWYNENPIGSTLSSF